MLRPFAEKYHMGYISQGESRAPADTGAGAQPSRYSPAPLTTMSRRVPVGLTW